MATTTAHPSSKLLWRLSNHQHGVVTRPQLLAAGLSPAAIKHRVAIARLHPVGRGVYAVGRPQLSREGRWMAAALSCGDEAVLSHASATALWGIRPQHGVHPAHVSIPRGGGRRRPGVRVHRVKLTAEDVTKRDGIPVVTPARALLDQAAAVSPRRLERDINVADSLGLVNPERLRAALDGCARQPGVAPLRELLDRHTFTLTDSELEQMFLPVTRRAGLPEPFTRRRVNGFRVDFFWPSLGLVVETDGLRYHRTPAQQARDLVREQTHKAAGLEPLRFTHWQVAYDRPWVQRTLRRVAARLANVA